MDANLAAKRRGVIERSLDDTFLGKVVQLPNEECGRIQTLGVEWEGAKTFVVFVNLDGLRYTFDYSQFKEETKILR